MKKMILLAAIMIGAMGMVFSSGYIGGSAILQRDTFEYDYGDYVFNQVGFAIGGAHYLSEEGIFGLGYHVGMGQSTPTLVTSLGTFEGEPEMVFNASLLAQLKFKLSETSSLETGLGYGLTGTGDTDSSEDIQIFYVSKIETKVGVLFAVSDTLLLGTGVKLGYPINVIDQKTTDSGTSSSTISFDNGFSVGGYLGLNLQY
mgnify:CR=1 FL=1